MKKVICPDCGFSFRVKREHWFSQAKCKKCHKVFSIEENERSFFYKKYKDLAAFGFDTKTGQPYWLDTKGKRVRHDSSEVRYDMYKDPRGWKSTGKKVHKDYGYGRW